MIKIYCDRCEKEIEESNPDIKQLLGTNNEE